MTDKYRNSTLEDIAALKREGYPAFPVELDYERPDGKALTLTYHGMTMLDYFAGQALVGLLTAGFSYQDIAYSSYKTAEAMLAERNKRNSC